MTAKRWNGNAVLAWITAVAFLVAVSWPHLSQSDLPLLGLRQLTAPTVGWPLAIVTLALALFLSMPKFLSRERLLVCAGFSLCLFVVMVFYVSPAGAVMFLFIGVNLIRENRLERA